MRKRCVVMVIQAKQQHRKRREFQHVLERISASDPSDPMMPNLRTVGFAQECR